jgi:hypothetical protein
MHVTSAALPSSLQGLSQRDADEALLLLKVDADNGRIDYSRLKEEVELGSSAIAHPPPKTLPQEELLFKVMKDLRVVFTKYDSNEINQHGLREALKQLGLKETFALKELLAHKSLDLTFSEFVSALTRMEDKDPSAQWATGHPRFASRSRGTCRHRRSRLTPRPGRRLV